MRSPDLPSRPLLNDLLKVAISPGEKRAAFEAAAKRGITASEFVRTVLSNALREAA